MTWNPFDLFRRRPEASGQDALGKMLRDIVREEGNQRDLATLRRKLDEIERAIVDARNRLEAEASRATKGQ